MIEGEKRYKRKEGEVGLTRRECTVCEHLYDPEQSDLGYFFMARDYSKGKIFSNP